MASQDSYPIGQGPNFRSAKGLFLLASTTGKDREKGRMGRREGREGRRGGEGKEPGGERQARQAAFFLFLSCQRERVFSFSLF